MAIPDETVNQVRESTDIVEIVSEYVSLKRKGGKNYFGLCPFHQEKTPSFSVHPDRQIFHCFGCGKGGNVYTFLMEVEHIEFPDAVRRLAERAHIEIKESGRSPSTGQNEELYQANELAFKFYRHRLDQTDGEDVKYARKYLRDRGISEEIESRFEIGLSPGGWENFLKIAEKRDFRPDVLERAGLVIRNDRGGFYDRFRERLMFPIRNNGGRVVGFGGRILKEEPGKESPKYLNSPETAIYHKGRMLYGIPQARDAMRSTGEAILVEGYTDLIALHRVDYRNSVATLGTALTSDQAALIKRFAGKVILLYDADEAGTNAAFRGADILVGAGLEVFVAVLPEGEDPDTIVKSGGKESLDIVIEQAKPIIDFKIEYFRKDGAFSTPRGQAEATRSLIDTLRRIPDQITRQFATHEIAEKLGVNEQILTREMEKVKQPRGSERDLDSSEEVKLDSFDQMLQDLIWVLLRNPDLIKKAFESFKSSAIGDHALRPAFDLLEAANVEGGKVTEAELYDSLNTNSEVLPLLNAILNRPEPSDPDYPAEVIKKAPLVFRHKALILEVKEARELLKQGADPNAGKRYREIKRELGEVEQKLFSIN